MTDTAISPARPGRETPERAPSGKQRILETAERLFANRGFLDVSAAEIVREAGVAHGLLFHHFGSMEGLYAEVSRAAAQQMNKAQQNSFRGRTAREQVASFLRAHVKAVKQRQGDALFRARSHNLAINSEVAEIWEASRQQAIDRICEVLGIASPTRKVRACMRAWIGFHDQLVLAWLADRSVSESEVLELTLRQLDQLACDVLCVELDRNV
ncbi:helix-turn-helix domain-containing protein [Variovorax sp. EBFNA2]|uniref:TetR/AcrR family transcriptional regulator n=1 Tax=Variovorax sp. EBFNA2 TaxID=3342097 RepID=UPI0029C003B2|nr:helix-turn-helix domain-containing protein [Variovorax boronicumulans]WPG41491.1 helix-turn-helix domain-containing protein [Variovorax boronicumulans]